MLQKFDPRNQNLLISINGALFPREEAKISVFDSLAQGGDGVWEGLRVYNGRIFCLDRHLDRLFASAHALAFAGIPDRDAVKKAIFDTLQANSMQDGVHIRLTLSRGEKYTSGMDPRLNTKGCTLIVLAEWKAPVYDHAGIRLVTSAIRRNGPQFLDSKIHHNNLLNNILAKIEANFAGVDDALMLDAHGFVAETNATNIFLVKKGELHTPSAVACLPGITRSLVLELAEALGLPARERAISVSEFYNADEVFVTGTMGELTPVLEIDGRAIPLPQPHGILPRIQTAFNQKTQSEGTPIPQS